jgi:hypothetical protein
VITKVRSKNPTAYLKIIAALVPRELPPPVQDEYAHLTDEELADRLIEIGTKVRQSINNPSRPVKKTVHGSRAQQMGPDSPVDRKSCQFAGRDHE